MKISKLLLMSFLHFLAMFILTYSAIATIDHFYININKFYMAAVMTAPMLVIEILLMGEMYKNKRNLAFIFGGSVGLLVLMFTFIRNQTLVNNDNFLRSMIPHHSSAILMCEQATITDPEIIELCGEIVKTQKEEIAIMEKMLNEKY